MYGQHQRSRSFSHFPQEQGTTIGGNTQQQHNKQTQQANASTPASPRESASQTVTPHPANMNPMEQQSNGSMIDNLLRRMRDAAGITNAGMVAAGMPTTPGAGEGQTEELLQQQQQQQQHQQQQQQQQQLMMMAMSRGGGAQAAWMQQQIQGMMPGGGYGTYPNLVARMGGIYQQQYPGMMNSAMDYMNPYAQQQQQQQQQLLLYNLATAGMYGTSMYGGMHGTSMYGQSTPGVYGNALYGLGTNMYGGSVYGNSMLSPYDSMGRINGGIAPGGSYPYYRSVDPYSIYQSHGYGTRSGFGMGYLPYDSYSKQMHYPERTSSVKSFWSRDYF